MPFSRFAGFLTLVVVSARLGAEARAQSRSPADEVQPAFATRDRDAIPSTLNRQATWLDPADNSPASAPADRSSNRGAAPDARITAIPLPPPSHSDRSKPQGPAAQQGGLRTAVTVVGSLGAVLGLFFLLAWAMRRGAPGAIGLLPCEALEVLGRAPLAGRQQVHLVRLGSKLVLVSVSPTGAETLSEVTEPDEVQRLIALCRQTHSTSAATMFRQALDRFTSREEPSDA
jgi:flagellar biogenesis protein FliO